MQVLQALAVLLWKNLWVQPFRHHYISTAAEMAIVALCFGVLWNRERPAPGTLRRSTDALVYSEETGSRRDLSALRNTSSFTGRPYHTRTR
ncbi:hypothetical protein MRX96_042077 [Rhipicephalus microplus]